MRVKIANVIQSCEEDLSFVASCRKPIFLIGMMGSGKTTIGKVLAQVLQRNFIDMDSEIEGQKHMTISEIFAKYGEKYFRNKERGLLKQLVLIDNAVISCGGGVFTFQRNIDLINQHGIAIFLNVDIKIIEKRLKNDVKRPILLQGSPSEILEKRLKFYNQAKVVLEIKKNNVQGISTNCIKALVNYLKEA